MLPTFSERLKTRVPSLKRFAERAHEDKRHIAYDLLPVLGLPERGGVSALVAAAKPKTPDFAPSDQARVLSQALKQDGLTPVQPAIPADMLNDVVDYFKATPCHDPFRPQVGKFGWDAPPTDEINMGYYTPEETLRAPHMLDLMNRPDVLQSMELRLGCKPVVDNIGAFWSYPDRHTAKGVQRFHRDYDSIQNIKLFYYLTDVDDDAGPHMFVCGSHHDRRLETGKAQTDEAIAEAFGTDRITAITGPAGSWFLEDVYGFHKGQLPVNKPRLLLAIQYNLYASPHCPKAPIMDNPGGYDPYINRIFLK